MRQTQESVNNGQVNGGEEPVLVEVDVHMEEQVLMDEVFADLPVETLNEQVATLNEPVATLQEPDETLQEPLEQPVPAVVQPQRRKLQYGEGPSRKRSERILLKKLGKKVEGKGGCSAKPMDVE